MSKPIVCDTSVWLYLGRIDQIKLLSQLYSTIYATETVCRELDVGRMSRANTIDPRQFDWVEIVKATQQQMDNLPHNRLGQGEQSVIAYAQAHDSHIVGLDDRQARDLAYELELKVVGTVGVLIKSKESKLITAIEPLIQQLRKEGFYISDLLVRHILKKTQEL